jgi:1,4-dihydroxy-2-naphthoyl-CoA hydrolase
MYDTDTAQILFFGAQFRFINDALEELLATIGLNMNILFTEKDYGFVVRHASSDYIRPSRVGDKLRIEIHVIHIGDTSFGFAYNIFNDATNVLVGKSKSVHVTIDVKTKQKITIPDELRNSLKEHLINEDEID